MLSLNFNKFRTCVLLIIGLMLCSCNSGSSPSSSTKNSKWSQISGDKNEPNFVGALYGLPNPNSIIMSDQYGYIWSYNNGSWSRLTNGGTNQPESLDVGEWWGAVYGVPTATSMVMVDKGVLWTYNKGVWESITGGVDEPSFEDAYQLSVYGLPTPESVVLVDNTQGVLWTYNNHTWESLNGDGNSGPLNVSTLYGLSTVDSLVTVDNGNGNGNLWVYSDKSWKLLTGLSNGPQVINSVYGSATPTSIVGVDYTNYTLWAYNNGNWESLTGGENQPPSVNRVYGNATPDTIIMQDDTLDGNLWVYDNKVWESITGSGYNEPQSVSEIFGAPTPNSMVMIDNDALLWIYTNGSWENITLNQFPTQWFGIIGLDIPYNNAPVFCGISSGTGRPNNCGTNENVVFALPVPDYIVMSDNNNFLWTYNGIKWTQQAIDFDTPQDVQYVAGLPTSESMVEVDSRNQLWILNTN